MNLNAFNLGMPFKWLPPKILLIMKLIIVLMISFLMQVSAAGYGQKINIDKNNTSLKEVLENIKKQTGYVFFSKDYDLKQAKISVKLKDADIDEALEACLKGLPLSYKIVDKTVFVQLKEKTFLERVVATLNSIDASGRVVDSENRPLPGASVKVKKTGKGVSTDKDGRFFLRGVEEGAVLVVSFIGYLPKEVSASANMGNVVLEQSLSKLDEVQVIAYGTTTQRLSTGNTFTVKASDIEKAPVSNPLLALAGRIPGVVITQSSGLPGSNVSVQIQGQNSLKNGNEAFFVIDGVPYQSQNLSSGINEAFSLSGAGTGSTLSFLNPSDIESVDFLKDADATAIYGSRAANGAILITTKKGKSGPTKVDLNMQNGWGKVTRKIDLLNTDEYIEMRKEAIRNNNSEIGETDYDLNGAWDPKRYTDWQKELIGNNSHYTNAQLSISGGNSQTQFLAGGGYNRETTVFSPDFDDIKANVRFNLNHSSENNKFKFGLSSSYMQDMNRLPTLDLTNFALTMAPNAPALYNSDGSINWAFKNGNPGFPTFTSNPAAVLLRKYRAKTNNLISNAFFSYEILSNLQFKTTLGFNRLETNELSTTPQASFNPTLTNNARSSSYGNKNIDTWIAEPQLFYSKEFSFGHLDALLGTTFQRTQNDVQVFKGIGYSNDSQLESPTAATNITPSVIMQSDYKYSALFGRINYRFKERYIVNTTIRKDGSSRFGSENQFNTFYSIGTAWIFSEEPFFKSILPIVNYGKLRVTYGTTGNDGIGDYTFLSLYRNVTTDIPYQGVGGILPTGHSNPYLQWEETQKLNLGLDFGFFNNRILLNTNFARNRSSNQLMPYPLGLITGFPGVQLNLPATVQNTSWEFLINAIPLKGDGFNWQLSFNLTLPKNKLIAYPDLDKSAFRDVFFIGKSTNTIKIYSFKGVNAQTGYYEFMNSSGELNSSPDYEKDRTEAVNLDPKFYGGLSNTLQFKGFEFSFLFQYVKQIAQNYRFGTYFPGFFNTNLPANFVDRWQQPSDIAPIQKVSNGFDQFGSLDAAFQSNAAYSDASYLRLKNASLSYTFPKKWLNGLHMDLAKVYVQGQNLLTLTNFNGGDPETRSVITLPPLRVLSLGLQLTF